MRGAAPSPGAVGHALHAGELQMAGEWSGLRVLTGAGTTDFSRDRSSAPSVPPRAVVFPSSADDVERAVTTCSRGTVPVVTRGAGSGLTGAATCARKDTVVVALSALPPSISIDTDGAEATVSASVTADALRAAAAPYGLWYAPDPASSAYSTIGGNIATNAAGMCCATSGRTGDHVLALDVVTGTGSHVCLARRGRPGGGGYDLASLLVGSEGTLGVIVAATVRLLPLPPPTVTVRASFDHPGGATVLLAELRARGVPVSVAELLDATTLAAVDDVAGTRLARHHHLVLLRTAAGSVALRAAEGSCRAAGASVTDVARDEASSEELFALRRTALPALERRGPVLLGDVRVPPPRLPSFLADVAALPMGRCAVAVFGHLLDGHLHPTVTWAPDDDAGAREAPVLVERVLQLARRHGGSAVGEHGSGLLKRSWVARESTAARTSLDVAVKAALDPDGIMNPGKLGAPAPGSFLDRPA